MSSRRPRDMSDHVPPPQEVVFCCLSYLRNIPSAPRAVQEATQRLERALVEARLLPTVYDYTGGERALTVEECNRLSHFQPSYVAEALAQRIQRSEIPVKTLFSNSFLTKIAHPNNNNNNTTISHRSRRSSTFAILNQLQLVDKPSSTRILFQAIFPNHVRFQKRLCGHRQAAYCVTYDCFGHYIVTGSDDHQLKVWSAKTAYLCHTLRGHDREINDITADPSRRILVSASRDSSIRVWDLVTGENLHVLKSGNKGVNCVLFSPCPDRPYLLSGSEDGIARLWNSCNFDHKCINLPLPSKRFNPRTQSFADSGSVRRMGDSFPAQSPTATAADSIPGSLTPSRMSSPPPPVARANVRIHDNEVTSGNPTPPVVVHSINNNNNARGSVNTGGPAAANNNNTNSVITQSARTPGLPGVAQTRTAGSGRRLGTRTTNGTVLDPRQTSGPVAGAHAMHLRNTNTRNAPAHPPQAPAVTQNNNNNNNNNSVVSSSPFAQVLSVAFNTGATRLAISGTDCMTHVYSITKESAPGELPTVQHLTSLRGHSEKIYQVLFAHHGDRLCTASSDGTARIYRRTTARVPPRKRKGKKNCTDATNSLTGVGTWKSILLDCRQNHSEVPSISHAGGAASTSITPRVPRGRIPSSVNAVMWSLRDDYVISASSNGKVRVWDSLYGRLLHVLDAHTGEVYIMDTHPVDERIIFTAGYDGKCILWDIEKGIELRRFYTDDGNEYGNQHPQVINGRFSPDGMSFIVTDTLGAMTIFGIGSADAMLLSPEEQFFANDIIPFRRNAQHRAISQENGQLLHTIPRGDLCDSQLRKYPLEIQLHSKDFYRNLPGAEKEDEASKYVANARNAKGEEFRLNQQKEEYRLVRTAIEEKRRAARARKKQELEQDFLPNTPMRDFVVSDSDKGSDSDYRLEEYNNNDNSDYDLPTSDEEKNIRYADEDEDELGLAASEDECRPSKRRRRKTRVSGRNNKNNNSNKNTRKRTRKENKTMEKEGLWTCTCKEVPQRRTTRNSRGRTKRIRKQSSEDSTCTCRPDASADVEAEMSDDNEINDNEKDRSRDSGSDESYRVGSDEEVGSDSSEDESGVKRRRKNTKKDPRRTFTTIDYRAAADTSSQLPRMQIHLSRAEVNVLNNNNNSTTNNSNIINSIRQGANGSSNTCARIPEARRSPGRSLTSERRPEVEDNNKVLTGIIPQVQTHSETTTPAATSLPAFSRASSSNFPNAITSKSNAAPGTSAQWSTQSVRIPPSTQAPVTRSKRRRSPRNLSNNHNGSGNNNNNRTANNNNNINGNNNTVVPLNLAAIVSPSSRMNNNQQNNNNGIISAATHATAPLPPIWNSNINVNVNHQQNSNNNNNNMRHMNNTTVGMHNNNNAAHNNRGMNNNNNNRLPTRSAQSVEAAGGGSSHFAQQLTLFGTQATTSESRYYSPTPANTTNVPPSATVMHHQIITRTNSPHPDVVVIPYQENSRHEHSSISIAAASTMSCAGENANIAESTENNNNNTG